MENTTPEIETIKSPLYTKTPLSKYMAMALFVLLPFVGGWIGYTYSQETMDTMEITTNSNEWNLPQNNNTQNTDDEISQLKLLLAKKSFPQTEVLKQGDSLGAFLVESVDYETDGSGEYYQHRATVNLIGSTTISGKILIDSADMGGSESGDTAYYIRFQPSGEGVEKVPYLEGFRPSKGEGFFIAGQEQSEVVRKIIADAGCSEDLTVYCVDFEPTSSEEIEVTISGFKLYGQSYASGVPNRPATTLVLGKDTDLTEYSNETLGIYFEYPSYWGKVTNIGTDTHFQFEFSGLNDSDRSHFLSAKSNSWDENTDGGRGGYWGDNVNEVSEAFCADEQTQNSCWLNENGVEIYSMVTSPEIYCDTDNPSSVKSISYKIPSKKSGLYPTIIFSDSRIANTDCQTRDKKLESQFKAMIESIRYIN